MRELAGSTGAKSIFSEAWVSLVVKLCGCLSAALNPSCLTPCSAPVVRLHLDLEQAWFVRGSRVEPSIASFTSHMHVPPSPLPGFTSVPDLQRERRRRGGVHTYSQKPGWPRTGQVGTTPPWRLTAALPGCGGALGKELCSQALGSIFLPAETLRLGWAPVLGGCNPGLFPVM